MESQMKAIKFILSIMALATVAACACRAAEPSGNAPQVDRTKWFREAKFGMFIHWGPYSLASVEASWPIMAEPGWGITELEYRALPQRFDPVNFDPKAWVRLAKAAGQRYMVFTTKHHDGFSMFDSAYTNYKITNTPYKQDIVAELAAAAQAEGLPLGFYYSPPDMNHPAYRDTSKPASTNWHGEPTRAEWPLYLDYMELQLTELLTRYGKVAIIWFDSLDHEGKYEGWRFHDLIHRLQPATLINNRIGVQGDYDTPEQVTPKFIPTKRAPRVGSSDLQDKGVPSGIPNREDFRLWETCMTINDTWAYNKNDRKFKSTQQLIRTLVDVASKGGNFLLNVGPMPDGTIQPEFEERLRGIGAWLKINGEAIYGTMYGPLQNLPYGRTTQKGRTVYLHVLDWPQGRLEVKGLGQRVLSASLLAGRKPLRFTQNGDHLSIQVPAEAPDPNVTVIALKTK
jgi:alpha-L-fucosidase